MLYALVMTLCLSSCNETIPESYYSQDDCVEALMQIDRAHISNDVVSFRCEVIED